MTRQDLLVTLETGPRPRCLLFYGGPLSQWAPAPFTVNQVRYPTAEHWMMAQKAQTFGDDTALDAILGTDDPAVAKAIGRKVAGYNEAAWAAIRFDVVVKGNIHKFGQNLAYFEYLLSTGDQVLVEASGEDRIWGVGLWENDPRAHDPRQWQGENLLGFALMEVRRLFRDARS